MLRLAVPQVVVPLAALDRSTLGALAFARSISWDVTAIHVSDDAGGGERMRRRWAARSDGIPLVIVDSRDGPIRPLLAYLDQRERMDPERPLAVVLAQLVPHRVWSHVLHDQTSARLKLRLLFRPNTVVVDVPYHLHRVRTHAAEDGAQSRDERLRPARP